MKISFLEHFQCFSCPRRTLSQVKTMSPRGRTVKTIIRFALALFIMGTFSAITNAQGPQLPTLPPQPVPLSPVPKFKQAEPPVQTQVNKVPTESTPTPNPVEPMIEPVPTPVDVQSRPPVNHSANGSYSPVSPQTTQPAPIYSQSYPHQQAPVYQPGVQTYSTPAYPPTTTYSYPMQNGYVVPQQTYYELRPIDGDGINPAGAEGIQVGPAHAGGLHQRYPLYDYRRPWYTRGPASLNVNIVW